jgi:hypothetical protein
MLTGWRFVVALAAFVALAGCAAFAPGPALGTFGSNGGLLGAWSIRAVACSSSASQDGPETHTNVTFLEKEHHRFLGADLSTGVFSGGPFGSQTVAIVTRPDPLRQVSLSREACRRFEVAHHAQPDGSIGADVELDCDTGDGGRVVASLHGAGCR